MCMWMNMGGQRQSPTVHDAFCNRSASRMLVRIFDLSQVSSHVEHSRVIPFVIF